MYGWEMDYKESWALKNWCFWTVVLEKTLESPSNCKDFKPVNPKWNQSWIFIGGTDAEAETPVVSLPYANWLIGKDPDAEKNWSQKEKGMTEDEMVEWHHWLDGLEFEPSLGVGDRQWSLACCSPWGGEELDTTEQLNWIKIKQRPAWTDWLAFFQLCTMGAMSISWGFQVTFVLQCFLSLGTLFLKPSEHRGGRDGSDAHAVWKSCPLSPVHSFSHVRLFGTPWTAARQSFLWLGENLYETGFWLFC